MTLFSRMMRPILYAAVGSVMVFVSAHLSNAFIEWRWSTLDDWATVARVILLCSMGFAATVCGIAGLDTRP